MLHSNKYVVSNIHKDTKTNGKSVNDVPYFLKTLHNVVQSSDRTFIQIQLLWFTIINSQTAPPLRRCVRPHVHVNYNAYTSLELTVDTGKAKVVKSRSLKAVRNLMSFFPVILFSTSSRQATPKKMACKS